MLLKIESFGQEVYRMVSRRSDRELVEQMLNYLNEIIGVAKEGDLTRALNINSETANKWLELFMLIKEKCPDFNYKKLGRYRIIDMVDLGGLAQEISQAKLKKVTGTRYRVTRYEVLNAIYQDLKMIAKKLIYQLRFGEDKNWSKLIVDSQKAFNEILNDNVNLLAGSEGKDTEFQAFRSSLTASIEVFIKSIKNVEKAKYTSPASRLKLIKTERDFELKIIHIFQTYEEFEMKSGRKPDYLVLDKEKLPKSTKSSLLAELKVNLDKLPDVLQKPDREILEKRLKKHTLAPVLKCFTCQTEQPFPIHCTQRMDYEDGQLVCEICKKRIQIPACSECSKTLGIGVNEIDSK